MNKNYSIMPSADMKLPNGYGTVRKEKGSIHILFMFPMESVVQKKEELKRNIKE